MSSDPVKRISLWSGPRNISTALMYSFAQRADTVVYDEPLYGYYLSHSKAKEYHPGADEVIDSMENDGEKVVRMMTGPQPKPVAFFKNMTHHLLDLDRSFLQELDNVILTRDPREMLPSYASAVASPTMQDVGYEAHLQLLGHLDKMGIVPTVIDAKQLLLDPSRVLGLLCQRMKIPMDAGMLSWKAGARPEDGVWAKHWYNNVHRSTGFGKYAPKTEPFPDALKPLLDACLPIYHQLMELSLK